MDRYSIFLGKPAPPPAPPKPKTLLEQAENIQSLSDEDQLDVLSKMWGWDPGAVQVLDRSFPTSSEVTRVSSEIIQEQQRRLTEWVPRRPVENPIETLTADISAISSSTTEISAAIPQATGVSTTELTVDEILNFISDPPASEIPTTGSFRVRSDGTFQQPPIQIPLIAQLTPEDITSLREEMQNTALADDAYMRISPMASYIRGEMQDLIVLDDAEGYPPPVTNQDNT
jgi:hypothetical protein